MTDDELLELVERGRSNVSAITQVALSHQDPHDDQVHEFNRELRRLHEAGFDVGEWLIPESLLRHWYGRKRLPSGEYVPVLRVTGEEFLQRANPVMQYLNREVDNRRRERASRVSVQDESRSKAVFIGHGHSPLWRELKDFIKDDLHLDPKYFEQDSRVGMHMAEILSGFLDQATCAIIVLTADDEQADGRERARQNVVHEVGYFQGKLGFRRVALVVQDRVEEFSNVGGIVKVGFPGRQIKQAFPELQRWLKREGMIP